MENLTKNEFQRRWRPIFWGLVLVLAATILILDGAGVRFGYGINAWRIIFGVLLLAWLISLLIRRQFADLFIPLGLLFLVFEAPIAKAVGRENGKLLPTWTVIVATILITIGLNMILKPAHTVSVSGDDKAKSKTIGAKYVYLDARSMNGTVIRDHLGSIRVFFRNKNDYPGGSVVTLCDNFGKIEIHIPKEWDLIAQTGENVGRIDIPEHTGNGEKTLTLAIRDNTGDIRVEFDDTDKQ